MSNLSLYPIHLTLCSDVSTECTLFSKCMVLLHFYPHNQSLISVDMRKYCASHWFMHLRHSTDLWIWYNSYDYTQNTQNHHYNDIKYYLIPRQQCSIDHNDAIEIWGKKMYFWIIIVFYWLPVFQKYLMVLRQVWMASPPIQPVFYCNGLQAYIDAITGGISFPIMYLILKW